MHKNHPTELRDKVKDLYRSAGHSLRVAAAGVGIAFFFGFALSPATAAATSIEVVAKPELDSYLPSLAVLVSEETTPVAGPTVPPTDREILLGVCRERHYGEDCAKVLYGMVWRESQFESRAVGDHGRAQGFFQIHYQLHGVSLKCARDLKCSARWSLAYMERNGYPKYATHAIQCHNGCGVANGYAAMVKETGLRKWKEAEAAELALKSEVKKEIVAVASARAVSVGSESKGENRHDSEHPEESHAQLAYVAGREPIVVAASSK